MTYSFLGQQRCILGKSNAEEENGSDQPSSHQQVKIDIQTRTSMKMGGRET